MASNSILSIPSFSFHFLLILVAALLSGIIPTISGKELSIREATVLDLQLAFKNNQLNSRQLVEFYLKEIKRLNPVLKALIEVNPDALAQADIAAQERTAKAPQSLSELHGIPTPLKDNIATKDKLNMTQNPYTLGFPCRSSSGSAISVAANMAAVTLGTETNGSILCPSDINSVVGIKPTVGLTRRAGVIPISPRQDTVGPICRTVSDAAFVLEAIAGIDARDNATIEASQYLPKGGYAQFLKIDGLRGKRLGIVGAAVERFVGNDTFQKETFEKHLNTISEVTALAAEFKLSLNAYLKDLVVSPVRFLADVIAFNKKNPILVRGYPGVTVPAGYGKDGPFGILFGGLKGSEPKLIEIAYSFEQATKIRRPPPVI
ncbi:hypothetical protein L6164_012066 [Bauhinia variegata]|uniref:Uncharacterized protein n=1 Tax=Bauhinia variegata TaxID=167791 RepID=A0ACB9PA36_BAUVA|nr:hypothetical protein L6164_012066 [Bauhinia variegata]